MEEKTAIIREQNDRFRKAMPSPAGVPGQVMMTSGIQALCNDEAEPNKHLPALFEAVRSFDDFSEDNDPYHDHSFGAFDFRGEKVFWKVDYFDRSLKWGSPDPANPALTHRVLTLMLASEY